MTNAKSHFLGVLFVLLLERLLPVTSQNNVPGPSSNTGTVVIDKTNLALFTLSDNVANGVIPVTLTATSAAFESDVVVKCISDASTVLGYSKITFTNSPTVTQAQVSKTTNVPFTVDNNGRPIRVTCSGLSTPTDPTHIQQFTAAESDLVFVQITEPATVNFCSKTITVPNYSGVTSDILTLQFSDTIAVNNMTVTCQTCTTCTPPFVAGTSLAITIQPKLAVVGDNAVDMAYSWTGAGTDVVIECMAQSVAGSQYLTASSKGASATFTFGVGSVTLFPPIRLISSSKFNTELVLDAPLSSQALDVTFVCTLTQYNDTTSLADALANPAKCEKVVVVRVDTSNGTSNATTGSTPVTTVSPTDTGMKWALKEREFVFADGQHFKTIEAERSSWPTTTSPELMLLSCCAPSDNLSPKYVNKTVSIIAFSLLYSNSDINWTNASTSATSGVETVIKNPAFENMSPCPCDLVRGACDMNCCCDTDCTSDTNKTMTCYTGLYGGERTNGPEDRSCDSTSYFKEDWWMFTCVYYENNAYLGHYYNSQSGLRTSQAYASAVPAKRPTYSWEETDKRNVAETVSGVGYTEGLSIQTKVTGSIRKVGVLGLPQRILNGQCLRTAPVQYLVDNNSNCNFNITKATCLEVGGPFSARSYITASSISQPPCPNYPGVVSDYDGSVYSSVSTNYFCTTDASFSGYVKDLKDIEKVTSQSLFSTSIVDYASCEFNENGTFICLNMTQPTAPVTTASPRCAYDDSLNLPPEPTFDETNKVCNNVVLDVEYKFYWAGKKIVNLTANYIMGNVPVEMSYSKTVKQYSGTTVTDVVLNLKYPVTLTQKYSARYTHKYNLILLRSEDPNVGNTSGLFSPRSGYPGFEVGKPIIAGIGYYNTTTNTTAAVDYSQGNGIYYYKADADGLCTTAGKEQATFDEEILSSCAVYLTVNDFDNCDQLRKTMLVHLDTMMPANYLSQIGFVNDTNTAVNEHWVRIVRENLTERVFPTPVNETVANITATLTQLVTGFPNGTHDIFKPYEKIKGICTDIPTGIHAMIFSAYTGNINGREIHRITGGSIRYTMSTIAMRCTGSQGSACQNNSIEAQLFTMTATVDFTDVPRNSSFGIRYQQYQGKCWEEKCNDQMFYPFTKYYTQESYQYTLAWLLMFILFSVPTFLVTSPWW